MSHLYTCLVSLWACNWRRRKKWGLGKTVNLVLNTKMQFKAQNDMA
jgi:hypothetical protein